MPDTVKRTLSYKKFATALKENQTQKYFKENDNWLSLDNIKNHSGNKEGSFWTLVIRLHLYLRTKHLYSLQEISSIEDEMLKEIGWGNINTIEVASSLKKQNKWNSINHDIYWQVKTESQSLDSIKLIIDSFNPDIIFIFNWDSAKEPDVFRGLNAIQDTSKSVAGLLATYSLDRYDTKVVWCPHPNNLRYKSQNINGLIQLIASSLE